MDISRRHYGKSQKIKKALMVQSNYDPSFFWDIFPACDFFYPNSLQDRLEYSSCYSVSYLGQSGM